MASCALSLQLEASHQRKAEWSVWSRSSERKQRSGASWSYRASVLIHAPPSPHTNTICWRRSKRLHSAAGGRPTGLQPYRLPKSPPPPMRAVPKLRVSIRAREQGITRIALPPSTALCWAPTTLAFPGTPGPTSRSTRMASSGKPFMQHVDMQHVELPEDGIDVSTKPHRVHPQAEGEHLAFEKALPVPSAPTRKR